MPMISYAQHGEDVLLARVFAHQRDGFYIDVGAADPVELSVTKHFSLRGWRGVNVEPVRTFYNRLCRDRPRDVNLHVALSDREGAQTFYESPVSREWSSFNPVMQQEQGFATLRRQVAVTTLAGLCAQHVRQTIDFLKVDVELHERQVLAGGNWRRWRPRVVLAERNLFETWEPLLVGSDYLFAQDDGVNRYYVRAEDRQLLPALSAPLTDQDNYVPYRYARPVERLRFRFRVGEPLGTYGLGVAGKFYRLACRYPRVARNVERILRRIA